MNKISVLVLVSSILLPSLVVAQSTAVETARFAIAGALEPVETSPDVHVEYKIPLSNVLQDSALAGLEGFAEVAVDVRAIGQDTERVIRVRCPQVYWHSVPIGELTVRVWEPPFDDAPATLSVDFEGPLAALHIRATGAIRFDLQKRVWTGDASTLVGTMHGRVATLAPIGRILGLPLEGGPMVVDLKRTRDSEGEQIKATVLARELRWNDERVGNIDASWNHVANRSRITMSWSDKVPILDVEADLPLTVDLERVEWRAGDDSNLKFAAKGITPTVIKPWRRITRGVDFDLSATGEFSGKVGAFTVAADLAGAVKLPGAEGPIVATVRGDSAVQNWQLNWEQLSAQAETQVRLASDLGSTPVSARIDADIPLSAFSPFARWIGQPQGSLKAELTADGTLGSPGLTGDVSLDSAEFTFVPFNRRLSKIKAHGVFEDDVMRFESSAFSAPGSVKSSGTLTLDFASGRAETLAEISVDKFPFVHPDFPVGLVDGQASATYVAGVRDTSIDVQVATSRVRLLPERLPDTNMIPGNDDIAIIDTSDDEPGRRKDGYAITINLLDQVHVIGEGADVHVTGRLDVERRGDVVRVDGGFKPSVGSRFELFDNPFEIKDGLVSVAPGHLLRPLRLSDDGLTEPAPLEPTVNLVAEGKAEDTWVMVRLNGAFRRPKLGLASLPALPEYQIMTLLVTGRVDTVDDRNGNVRRAVARMVERYHNPSLERQLFDRIGIDKLGLGFRSSITNPVLTVGKQVTRTLYVETIYRHSAPPDLNMMEGHVEKRFGRHWTFDTVFGDAAEGSAGIFWRTTFGGPDIPEPTPDQWALKVDTSQIEDDDSDGIVNAFDVCQSDAEDIDGFQDDDGCPDPDNDRDGVADAEDLAPDEAETFNGFEDDDGKPDVSPARLSNISGHVSHLVYSKNETRFNRAHRPRLEALAELLKTMPDNYIVVEGHSDNSGKDYTIERVSRRRAELVVRELRRLKVPRNRIETRVLGASKPRVSGTSEAANAANRRVEILLVQREAAEEGVGKPLKE